MGHASIKGHDLPQAYNQETGRSMMLRPVFCMFGDGGKPEAWENSDPLRPGPKAPLGKGELARGARLRGSNVPGLRQARSPPARLRRATSPLKRGGFPGLHQARSPPARHLLTRQGETIVSAMLCALESLPEKFLNFPKTLRFFLVKRPVLGYHSGTEIHRRCVT